MGNICRSPTAEEVLRVKARAAGIGMHFDSAGTEGYHVGDPPDPRSIKHARRRGYDLTALRARRITSEDFLRFDLILAADRRNIDAMRGKAPRDHLHKLTLLLGTEELPDPYYGEAEDFERVLDLVEKRADLLIRSWSSSN
ncbi:MAG: hypothetical protein RL646_1404 [Verrucomicrobiota bacterium]|jgi:protein-tyrosine phosphatase